MNNNLTRTLVYGFVASALYWGISSASNASEHTIETGEVINHSATNPISSADTSPPECEDDDLSDLWVSFSNSWFGSLLGLETEEPVVVECVEVEGHDDDHPSIALSVAGVFNDDDHDDDHDENHDDDHDENHDDDHDDDHDENHDENHDDDHDDD
jgi:hypothetical protein